MDFPEMAMKITFTKRPPRHTIFTVENNISSIGFSEVKIIVSCNLSLNRITSIIKGLQISSKPHMKGKCPDARSKENKTEIITSGTPTTTTTSRTKRTTLIYMKKRYTKRKTTSITSTLLKIATITSTSSSTAGTASSSSTSILQKSRTTTTKVT
ncbi:unnamed protein product [Rotaria sp. Silwood2]|nr:unnamed protein product [Rotaria sp. Silwood2]CAF4053661.1 unnamed protein product [Rotaria sp. Silwood2]